MYLTVPRINDRVTSWISPFDHPQTLGYQMVQSLYALGDGGIVGPGLGRGFLVNADGSTPIPELRTDFIFSAVANELGYVGAIGVLLVFVLVAYRGFVIAAQANDGFSKLLAGGLTAVLGLPGVPDRRGHRPPDPAHRRDPAVHELRRIERGGELRGHRPAAGDQPSHPPPRRRGDSA